MRIVAGDALALRSRMRHLGFLDLLHLIAVAGRAERPAVRVRQHDLAVFRRQNGTYRRCLPQMADA